MSNSICSNGMALKAWIQAFLPIQIEAYHRKGGPWPSDWERTAAFADTLAAHADTLLFGSKQPGEAGKVAGQLIDALAVISFVGPENSEVEQCRARQIERWIKELGKP